MGAGGATPEPQPDCRSDWLAACHGFRVDAGGKRVGVVEDVLFGAKGAPAALVVQGGLFGTRTFIVSAEDVGDVLPRSKRILLVDAAAS